MTPEMLIECAWCARVIDSREEPDAPEDRTSHGICLDCLGGLLEMPVTDMHDLSSDQVDRLPFGMMELTRMGVVRRYNQAEARLARTDPSRVVGRDFFREVAPCTQATEFEARWRELLKGGGGDADFEFVFRFEHGHRLVRIRMIVDPDLDRNLILVQDLEAGDDVQAPPAPHARAI